MLRRVYIKDLLGFKELDIEFEKGLNIITGPSGAGKSVFMGSILANFGFSNQEANLCEVELLKPKNLESEAYEFDDEITIKAIKKDRVRFFIDGQKISKKALKELFGDYISYISVRQKSGFESERLLEIVDNYCASVEKSFLANLNEYKSLFREYRLKESELESLKKKIKESNERVEFLKYEIEKISSLNPKEGEYEELLTIKKQLSKLDKISEIASRVDTIFNYEDELYELFSMLNKDSSYLSDAMNQLRSDLEDIESLSEELAEVNIEEVLNRLEELNALIKRFGSIAEALNYLEEKRAELESFETINEDVSHLEEFVAKCKRELMELATEISKVRKKGAQVIEERLFAYLKELKLPKAEFIFMESELYDLGIDTLTIELNGSKVEQLSGGEFNRVRLALLTVNAENRVDEGVIILDEIDANVSGDESIAIANMISRLSKSYQIFAISHQPHLSSKADRHIFINKDAQGSYAKVLNRQERVEEIARIIGGENFDRESLEFAKKVIDG